MGNFVHHLSGGVVAGVTVGYVGYTTMQLSLEDSLAGGVLCAIASLLPDIDSQESRPNQLLFQALSALAPIVLIQRFAVQWSWSKVFLIAVATYLLVGWGVRAVFAKLTVHRGIFHSIPMAIIAGASAFLLYDNLPLRLRHYVATVVTVGYAVHLIIDEMFSFVNFEGVRLSPKESFGTALKFGSPSALVTITTYGIMGVLLYWCLRSDAQLLTRPLF